MTTVSKEWQRLERILDRVAPEVLQDLAPGVSESSLARAERTLGQALPGAWREWLRTHECDHGSGAATLFSGYHLLPLDAALQSWSERVARADRTHERSHGDPDLDLDDRSLLPVATDGAGDLWLLDLPTGSLWWWSHSPPELGGLADDFAELLHEQARALETGDIVATTQTAEPFAFGGLVRRTDLREYPGLDIRPLAPEALTRRKRRR